MSGETADGRWPMADGRWRRPFGPRAVQRCSDNARGATALSLQRWTAQDRRSASPQISARPLLGRPPTADCRLALPTADRRLPTADCRLPTADCRLPTAAAHRRLPTADSRPPAAGRRPPTADRRPPTADRRPPTADRRWRLVIGDCRPATAGRRLLTPSVELVRSSVGSRAVVRLVWSMRWLVAPTAGAPDQYHHMEFLRSRRTASGGKTVGRRRRSLRRRRR